MVVVTTNRSGNDFVWTSLPESSLVWFWTGQNSNAKATVSGVSRYMSDSTNCAS